MDAVHNETKNMHRVPYQTALLCTLGALLAACSGGEKTSATGSFGGGRPPVGQSILGNWIIEDVAVIRDTGVKHRVRPGMTYRIANQGVLVAAGQYLAPDAAVLRLVEHAFDGEITRKESVAAGGFELELILDYSRGFRLPPRSVFDRIHTFGKRVGNKLLASFLFQKFVTSRNAILVESGRDELKILCGPGLALSKVRGNWRVDALEQITGAGAHGVKVGSPLALKNRQITNLFGLPFTQQAFERANPDWQLVGVSSRAIDGIAQGLLLSIGRPGGRFDRTVRFVLADFVQVGNELRGHYVDARESIRGETVEELLVRSVPASQRNGNDGPLGAGSWILRSHAELEKRLRDVGRF